MKNLLVFLVVVAAIGLFLHDKQQTADLATARTENDALTQQLADKTRSLGELQSKVQQLTNQLAAAQAATQSSLPSRISPPAGPGAPPASQSPWGLQGSGPLDRPAYKDH